MIAASVASAEVAPAAAPPAAQASMEAVGSAEIEPTTSSFGLLLQSDRMDILESAAEDVSVASASRDAVAEARPTPSPLGSEAAAQAATPAAPKAIPAAEAAAAAVGEHQAASADPAATTAAGAAAPATSAAFNPPSAQDLAIVGPWFQKVVEIYLEPHWTNIFIEEADVQPLLFSVQDTAKRRVGIEFVRRTGLSFDHFAAQPEPYRAVAAEGGWDLQVEAHPKGHMKLTFDRLSSSSGSEAHPAIAAAPGEATQAQVAAKWSKASGTSGVAPAGSPREAAELSDLAASAGAAAVLPTAAPRAADAAVESSDTAGAPSDAAVPAAAEEDWYSKLAAVRAEAARRQGPPAGSVAEAADIPLWRRRAQATAARADSLQSAAAATPEATTSATPASAAPLAEVTEAAPVGGSELPLWRRRAAARAAAAQELPA